MGLRRKSIFSDTIRGRIDDMDQIKTGRNIQDGIRDLELASGQTLTALEFVRATLGANLDKFVSDGARVNPNLRGTVHELVTHAITALEELREIPKGLEVIAVTQGKFHFVIVDSETKRVLADHGRYEESMAHAAFDAAKAKGLQVEFHLIDERDVIGVEFGIVKGTPTSDVEKLLAYLGGGRKCLV